VGPVVEAQITTRPDNREVAQYLGKETRAVRVQRPQARPVAAEAAAAVRPSVLWVQPPSVAPEVQAMGQRLLARHRPADIHPVRSRARVVAVVLEVQEHRVQAVQAAAAEGRPPE